jgi:hypothetical protein
MKYFIARKGSGKGRGNATPACALGRRALLKYFEPLKQAFGLFGRDAGRPPRAVQYIVSEGQRYKTASGRVFTLSARGGRIELIENDTARAFILVEHYGCKPSAALVLKIGAAVIGERLKTVL